jgi:hypothetical protein
LPGFSSASSFVTASPASSQQNERAVLTSFGRAQRIHDKTTLELPLTEISKDAEVAEALFEVLETQKIVEGEAELTLVPKGPNKAFLI